MVKQIFDKKKKRKPVTIKTHVMFLNCVVLKMCLLPQKGQECSEDLLEISECSVCVLI